MFPFLLRGEIRIPGEIRGGLDLPAALGAFAAALRAQGAEDVTVRGEAVTFTAPPFAGRRGESRLRPADAGVVALRDDAGVLVMTYQLRMRRTFTYKGLLATGLATFSSLAGNAVGIAVVCLGFGIEAARAVASIQDGFPRSLLAALAREAQALAAGTGPPAAP